MLLSCGEALIDMIPSADGSAFRPIPGGAALNLARSAARLGLPAALLCPLSQDMFGAQLVAALEASGVETALAPRVEAPCPLAFVRRSGGENQFAFFDTGSALHVPLPLPAALPAEVSALCFGGISLIGDPLGADLETLAHREAGGRLLVLDPNIRPGFIKDEAGYRARLARMLRLADLVKISDEDLGWLYPAHAADAAIAAMRAEGPAVVLLTKGAAGAECHHAGGVIHLPAPRVPEAELADTVGAGDAFNAGFLAGLWHARALSREGLRGAGAARLGEALALGIRVASASVRRPGAEPPGLEEARALLA